MADTGIDELLRDKKRLDWLADSSQRIGEVLLPREIVERNMGSLRDAIDESMELQPQREQDKGGEK